MDNFILYDEIFKTETTIIHKGRRKGSINYVGIHCIDKTLRPEITNLVRLTYEMSHKNTVKFYEWYETSNHLWLVVELCTCGPLEIVLEQDGCLPESSIRQFGIDLCEGLFYVHSLGLLFCDLNPKKVMVDGNGNLKLADFGYSKQDGEDLESIFLETYETTSSQWAQSVSNAKPPKVYKKPFGDLNYMAPELLLGEDNSQKSDFWSLGCIFYRMYTGSCPFVADDPEHQKNLIINKELPNPKGNKLSVKPSNEFLSLLKGLLHKSPSKRLSWRQLINHEFWEGKLKHLIPIKSVHVDDEEENEHLITDRKTHLSLSRLSTDRPRTAGGLGSIVLDQQKPPEVNVSFSISSRLPASPQATMQTRNPIQCKESDEQSSVSTVAASQQQKTAANAAASQREVLDNMAPKDKEQQSLNEYRRMFFLPSELNVSQIIDNPKIQKPASLKFEPKALPFTNPKYFKAETMLTLPRDELTKCLTAIKANTNVPSDKSAGAIKLKLHLMNYIGSLCCESAKLADSFVQIELYKDLMTIIKNGHNLEMKMKAARIMAIMFNKAKKLDSSKELTEAMQSLIDIISANRKDLKFKQALLPALGELIYIVSCQEILLGKSIDVWSVPSLAYILLIRSMGEDLITNHIICKIIENIASTNSINVKKFLSNQSELINALWSCYIHSANNEQLRIAALNALAMLSSHSINVFTSLIDKVGIDPILDCLSSGNSHVQQPVLTMLTMLLNESSSRVVPEKKLISKLISIYESTNVVCRSKAYLLTFVLLKQQNDLLTNFVHSKLINSIERDGRKVFTVKEENDYMHKVINMLIEFILNMALAMIDETLNVLESINGRKNPSTTQTKQLKRCIPNMSILKPLISSQNFRSKIVNKEFMDKFGKVLKLSKPIDEGDINLDNICGPGALSDYINSLIGVLESLMQNNDVITTHYQHIIKFILPSLMDNLNSTNTDMRVESLKMISELTTMFFGKRNNTANEISQESKQTLKSTLENQFVQSLDELLSQPEPLPFLALTIIQPTLVYDITFINVLKVKNVLPALIKCLVANKLKVGSPILVQLLSIFDLWSSTVDPSDLYDNGIVDPLKSMIMDISRMRRAEFDRITIDTLIELLKILDNLLKYLSELVKRALQMKKIAATSGATGAGSDIVEKQAERLLHLNRPLVACNSFLISLFIHEDNDLNEISCRIVWVIMQLFGTECKDLLTQETLNILLNSIMNSNAKKQKILLRIVKRIITVDKQNLEHFKAIGSNFLENMKSLKSTANAEANVALSTTIDEILKLV